MKADTSTYLDRGATRLRYGNLLAAVAAVAESFRARALGDSAAPRLARGMNPTMDLERATMPISLSW